MPKSGIENHFTFVSFFPGKFVKLSKDDFPKLRVPGTRLDETVNFKFQKFIGKVKCFPNLS